MKAQAWQLSVVRRDGSAWVPSLLSGSFDFDISRKVVSGGRFTTADDPGSLIGAEVLLSTTLPGDIDARPVARGIATADDPSFTATGGVWTVEWMDDSSRLEKARLLNPVGLPATTLAAARVRARLAEVGVSAAVADSDRTLRTALAFTPEQTRLDEVNTLLGAAGLHPLWSSPTGLVAARWPDVDKAAPAHAFTEGEESLHLPDYPVKRDHLSVPNRLLLTSKGDGKSPSLSAVARDAASTPWSFQARGFWVDAEPGQSDAATQADLVDDANRKLREVQMAAVTMTIRHMWTPSIQPGVIVVVDSDRPEVDGRWQVTGSSIDIVTVDALASTSLRRVITW